MFTNKLFRKSLSKFFNLLVESVTKACRSDKIAKKLNFNTSIDSKYAFGVDFRKELKSLIFQEPNPKTFSNPKRIMLSTTLNRRNNLFFKYNFHWIYNKVNIELAIKFWFTSINFFLLFLLFTFITFFPLLLLLITSLIPLHIIINNLIFFLTLFFNSTILLYFIRFW